MTTKKLFAASLLAASMLTISTPASAQRIERIVAFGDSYADDGNFFQLTGINPASTIVYPTGRFSGGTNYIDTLGTILGVPIDNFAIGGALTDNRNTNGPPLGFITEYNSFLAGGGPAAFPRVSGTFGPNDLLAVSVGGNDARFYQQTGGTAAGAQAAATTSAAFATTGLNALVNAGARNISFLAGDTGRLPEIASNPAGAAIRSSYSATFNNALQSTLAGYAANGVTVHYLDLNRLLDQVTADFAGYGLTGLACPAFPNTTCIAGSANPFLFYGDQLHLTSAGYAIVGRYIAAQLTAPLTLQAPSDLGLDVARQFGRTLTARLDGGAPRDGDLPEGVKVFAVGDGFARRLDRGQYNDEFRASGVGGTLGVEVGFGSGVAGLAGNVSKARANFGNDAADVDTRSYQVGGYVGFGIAGAFAQGYAGYGWDRHDIQRTGVVEGMDAEADGNHFLAGGKVGYLANVGNFRAGPVVALDYARAKVDGYTEEGDDALTLDVSSIRYSSLRGSAGLEVRGDFGGNGVQFRPYASALVEKDFTGDERTIRYAQTASPIIVNSFAFEDGSKKLYGRFNAGFSAAILSNVSLDVSGSATVGKDQGEETSAQLGVRIGF
ncbi:autotransporter domain-containing protein [Sphingomonas sp. LY160]|uniref:autotransporter domain-containing protein n=1 Tax=Sphingomonas sp. LY160 TaxID=3095342 RepID=UPI002ADEBE1E|nr:autotransporter domain-containing protein [Sphingomonas sp. LY160]MEA1072135.1 autotransporter domain-containing protein [Sphingomonas sp. LY160]